jgi:hypothetical protein
MAADTNTGNHLLNVELGVTAIDSDADVSLGTKQHATKNAACWKLSDVHVDQLQVFGMSCGSGKLFMKSENISNSFLCSVAADLPSACIASFTLIYLSQIRKLDVASASLALCMAQLVHALSMPLIGLLQDFIVSQSRLEILYSRKLWNTFGICLCLSSFFAMFALPCLIPEEIESFTNGSVLYYGICLCMFNLGYAFAQISSAAIVSYLYRCEEETVLVNR